MFVLILGLELVYLGLVAQVSVDFNLWSGLADDLQLTLISDFIILYAKVEQGATELEKSCHLKSF